MPRQTFKSNFVVVWPWPLTFWHNSWSFHSLPRAWIWMKCCVSTDVGTWTNWLTLEPDPDYSPDAGTGLLSPISYALQRGILLRRENPAYAYWHDRSLQRGVVLKWFYSPRAVGTPLSEVRVLYRVPSSLFSNYHNKTGWWRTNGRTDGPVGNVMLAASLNWRKYKNVTKKN